MTFNREFSTPPTNNFIETSSNNFREKEQEAGERYDLPIMS
jgi:hypothetical protein